MLKIFAVLFLSASFSITAQQKETNYFLESYSINLHPLGLMKGYMPLTLELRLNQRFSVETGPALVTRPYLYFFGYLKPEVNTFVDNSFTGFVSGEASYRNQLGWETNFKYYFDRDIWESKYIGIFHSYRNTKADLISISDGRDDIKDYAVYRRNHLGFKYGTRYFLNESIGSVGDSWVCDTYIGISYAYIENENFNYENFFGLGKGNLFLHFGISVGILKE
jgi:hypothetical protein